MSNDYKFLMTYGLQNFVTHTQSGGKSTFTIRKQESQKMVRHAKSLIIGSYGETARIQVV